MLLAREGYRVLLLDKATFPSDTMSTHLVHPPGVAALERWGLLDRLVATGCPPVERYSFDFGPVSVAGSPQPIDGVARAYGPRRTVLDKLLVDAAAEAGAEVRESFTVEEIVAEDETVTGIRGHATGGETVTERAQVVIGADGKHSLVVKAVKPESYNERPSQLAMYYAYWSGLPVTGFETTIRAEGRRGWAALPTHDGLTCMPFGWPVEEFKANRGDIEGNFFAAIDLAPEFAERVRSAKRESKFIGSAELPGYFRKPFGPGWVLVGDAGYHKNPITAMGINDAFRDAELAAGALDDAFTGRRSFEEGMGDYQRTRDQVATPVYEFTCDFATMEPPPPEMQQLIGAMQGNQEAQDAFISVQASTMPAPEFFAPENVGKIMSQAGVAG
jgi:2-polyprenyl-6-methoxyphenol hydroxylase-like FAD-dependent oxidoreductase